MSRPRRVGDAERTAIMLDLIGVGHLAPNDTSMPPASVALEEVAPTTGWVQRLADVLVLGVWKKTGQRLDGYEIKASRADLKRELADLTKHEAVAQYCDTWTLVAWDEDVVYTGDADHTLQLWPGIPESWGITVTVEVDGDRQLEVRRKPATRVPVPWPRSFVCSLVRNAYQQSPGAAYLARAVSEATNHANHHAERQRRADLLGTLEPLNRFLYGNAGWNWPAESRDAQTTIAKVLERLNQGILPLAGAV